MLKDYYNDSFHRLFDICIGIWADQSVNDECYYVNKI